MGEHCAVAGTSFKTERHLIHVEHRQRRLEPRAPIPVFALGPVVLVLVLVLLRFGEVVCRVGVIEDCDPVRGLGQLLQHTPVLHIVPVPLDGLAQVRFLVRGRLICTRAETQERWLHTGERHSVSLHRRPTHDGTHQPLAAQQVELGRVRLEAGKLTLGLPYPECDAALQLLRLTLRFRCVRSDRVDDVRKLVHAAQYPVTHQARGSERLDLRRAVR